MKNCFNKIIKILLTVSIFVSASFCYADNFNVQEQIMKEMKPNTRNTIRKAEKFGITVNEIGYDELERFQSIMEETSKRKGFANRKLSYYQEMYNLFHDKEEIKYFITELNLKKYVERLRGEREEKSVISKIFSIFVV